MERFARVLVRWRWVVLAVWAGIGAVAAVRAPATPALLNIRGGSARETEASRAEKQLNVRFSRPIAEFFAVTLEGPGPLDQGPGRVVLDSLLDGLTHEPYVRGLVSYPSTNDSTFLSRDRRSTFVIVALHLPTSDSAGALVPVARQAVRQILTRIPDGSRYTAMVTGRAPLDSDVRSVIADDSARGEKVLLPLTLIILVLAFGALVAAALPLVVGVLAIAASRRGRPRPSSSRNRVTTSSE